SGAEVTGSRGEAGESGPQRRSAGPGRPTQAVAGSEEGDVPGTGRQAGSGQRRATGGQRPRHETLRGASAVGTRQGQDAGGGPLARRRLQGTALPRSVAGRDPQSIAGSAGGDRPAALATLGERHGSRLLRETARPREG